jgi:hypothetical protein
MPIGCEKIERDCPILDVIISTWHTKGFDLSFVLSIDRLRKVRIRFLVSSKEAFILSISEVTKMSRDEVNFEVNSLISANLSSKTFSKLIFKDSEKCSIISFLLCLVLQTGFQKSIPWTGRSESFLSVKRQIGCLTWIFHWRFWN